MMSTPIVAATLAAAARLWDISRDDLVVTHRRGQSGAVAARFAVALVLRDDLHMPFQSIARELRYTEHTSAINAVQRARARYENDPAYAATVERLRAVVIDATVEAAKPPRRQTTEMMRRIDTLERLVKQLGAEVVVLRRQLQRLGV